MDKVVSNFYFWGAGYLLFVSAVIVQFIAPFNRVDFSSEVKVPKVLSCFSSTTSELRVSDVKAGCFEDEESLGSSAISRPFERPVKLDEFFQTRFDAAQVAARKAGFEIRITSGFRSIDLQESLFRDAVTKYGSSSEASKWVLPKLVSNHPWGIAIDVNYLGDKVAVKWLELNGEQFGICRIYENEWWHFEPVIAPGELCPPMEANALASLLKEPAK